jgi:transposase-like protein
MSVKDNGVEWDDEEYKKPYRDPELLRHLYWKKKMSLSDISSELNCGRSTVAKWMEKNDIPKRKPDDEKYPRPRTQSEYASGAGYEVIVHHNKDEKYQVFHHRLLAAAQWGVEEVDGKHVHHKNGVEWDNRIENFELLSHNEHSRKHRLSEPNNDPWHDKERLRVMYIEQEMSMSEIAEIWGCDPVTIHNWLHRHNIETRTKGGKFDD